MKDIKKTENRDYVDLFCGVGGIVDKSVANMVKEINQTKIRLLGTGIKTMDKSIMSLHKYDRSLYWRQMESSLKVINETLEPCRKMQKNILATSSLQKASELVLSMPRTNYEIIGMSTLLKAYSNIALEGCISSSKLFEQSVKSLVMLQSSAQFSTEMVKSLETFSKCVILTSGINTEIEFLDTVNDIYEECYQDDAEAEGFKSNVEVYDAIVEQVQDPVGFQEKAFNWNEKMIKQFFIAYMIVSFLWSNFMQPYFQEYVGVPVTAWAVAHVRELPEKASEIIGELKEDINATVMEAVPYYYKITFVDENGIQREGYVSKRSVRLIEELPEEKESDKEDKR